MKKNTAKRRLPDSTLSCRLPETLLIEGFGANTLRLL
jgi:hypothetical protein